MFKKYLLSLLFILSLSVICVSIKAQNCKPDKETIDKFTKQKVAFYNYDLKDGKVSLDVMFSLAVVNDTSIVAIVSFMRDVNEKNSALQPLKISKGQSLFIANETSNIELKCVQDALSAQKRGTMDQNHVILTITANYIVTPKDLEILSKEVFSDIQIRFDQTNPFTGKFKKKIAEKIKNDVECLLPSLQKSSK